jgi:DNA-binding transcriptional regulator YiaG
MLATAPTDFPVQIYDLRKRLGMTQEQFAAVLGVTYATVNAWENGRHRPGRQLWRQITTLEEESQ